MKKIELLLKKIDRKVLQHLLTVSIIFSAFVNYATNNKLQNGFQFYISFFSILVNIYCFVLFMLVLIVQENRSPKDPFYLFRYVSYLFLILMFISPFIYLWSMREVIAHLQWFY